jgi:hypothetical protein
LKGIYVALMQYSQSSISRWGAQLVKFGRSQCLGSSSQPIRLHASGCVCKPVSTFDPAVLFAPDIGIESLLANNFADVTLVGIEDLNGRPHYHLRGTLPAESLRAISLNLLGAGPVATDLWADQETLRASRVILVDTATDATNPSTWTLEFSEYDKAVDVREPVQCP